MKRLISIVLLTLACLAGTPASAKIVFVDPAGESPTGKATQQAAAAPKATQVAAAAPKAPRAQPQAKRVERRETPAWARRLEGAASRARAGR